MGAVDKEAGEKRYQAMEACAAKIEKILADKYASLDFKRMGCSPSGFTAGKKYLMPASSLEVRLELAHTGRDCYLEFSYNIFKIVIKLNVQYKNIQRKSMSVYVDGALNEAKFCNKLEQVIAIAEVQNNWLLREKIKLHQTPLFKDLSLVVHEMEDGSVRAKISESHCTAFVELVQEEQLKTVVLKIPELSSNQLSQILKFIHSLEI
jgi:hypothetical protein